MMLFFFFKQKTAYEMRISDWSSDVCSSDLSAGAAARRSLQADPGGMAGVAGGRAGLCRRHVAAHRLPSIRYLRLDVPHLYPVHRCDRPVALRVVVHPLRTLHPLSPIRFISEEQQSELPSIMTLPYSAFFF